jgi:REP element-mobilizing transposase RayT
MKAPKDSNSNVAHASSVNHNNVAHASSVNHNNVAHASSVPSPVNDTQDACTTFFDPHAPIQSSKRNLPHWYQDGAAYFATFRLADSIPQSKLKQWHTEREEWKTANPEPLSDDQLREYAERFPDRFQKWLDAGRGACVLENLECGRIVANAMHFFDGQRYHLDAWVVMPNHVHVIFQTMPPYTPKEILHSWKSYSANKINELLEQSGTLWQKESYDHIIRSPAQLYHYRHYIAQNPTKAGITVDHINVTHVKCPSGASSASPK